MSLDAERAVLGSVLLDATATHNLNGHLNPAHFQNQNHREICAAMLALEERGTPIDLVTLLDELEERGAFNEICDKSYLAGLVGDVIDPENVRHHAEIVVRDHRRRVANRVIREAVDKSEYLEPSELVQEIEEKLTPVLEGEGHRRGLVEMDPLLDAALAQVEGAKEGKGAPTGIPTGYWDLDRLILGLHPSDLVVVAARPAMGKTAFMLNLAGKVACRERRGVAIFSLEMSAESLANRMICTAARVSSMDARKGNVTDEEMVKLDRACALVSQAPIWIDDTPLQSVSEMRTKVRRLRASGRDIGVVMVDYIQLMGKGDSESRQVEVAAISRHLKAMARELRVPVVAMSQLNREVEKRKGCRPMLSNLRESGAIEQDADMVIFLHRPSYYEEERDPFYNQDEASECEVIVAKHRNGPVGTARLLFIRQHTRFEPLAKDA